MKLAKTAIIVFAVLLSYVTPATANVAEGDVSAILKRVDRELSHRDKYIENRKYRIDSLKKLISGAQLTEAKKLDGLLKIGDEYRAFNTDSAVWFYHTGYNLSRESRLDSTTIRFAIRGATYLPLQLKISRAQELMDSVDKAGVPEGLKEEFFDARRQMYSFIGNFYSASSEEACYFAKLGDSAQESLLDVVNKESAIYKLNEGELYLKKGKLTPAKITLSELIEEIGESDMLYARACHMLADIELAKGNEDGYTYFLSLSAISDTKCATLEVTSLQDLGKALYNRGDIDRAHNYLSIALKNAVDCNVSLRIIQTSQAFPYIENAHNSEIAQSKKRIFIFMGVLAVLLIFLGFVTWLVKRKNSQLHIMASRLSEANRTKDLYISQFLNLCSIYMDKLTQLNKMVNRKISAGKVDDLFKLTKSGRFVEEQSKEFYEVFDDAFLHLYPTFVEEVNELLLPDKKILLRDDEKMNTDLRILALMRLGIDDTSRIAQMLNYSVYTIYTYRNKFKAKAINRDEFEKKVMEIRSIA